MTNNSIAAEIETHRTQRETHPWRTLVQIWKGSFPPEAPQPVAFSIVVRLAVTPILVFRGLSPSTYVRNCGSDVMDVMVVGWTLLTTIALTVPPLRAGSPATLWHFAVAIYVYFRLADVTTQKLMEVLVHSVRPPLQVSIQRVVILSALNVYEIICCFAALYLVNGGVACDNKALSTPTSAFYFSTVTALTVGYGDFIPLTDSARRLVVSEIAVIAIFNTRRITGTRRGDPG